ncbi:MAG: hypothetical protein P4N60_11090 [Verrucomicrobiae bacterium]|nr:hypothetical protein [Verrucomicrobiae bacterium]
MNTGRDIAGALLAAFLPPEHFSPSAYSLITKYLTTGYAHHWLDAADVVWNTGYEPPPGKAHTFDDWTSEKRLKLAFYFINAMDSNFRNFDLCPAILNEFPAQRLIQVRDDVQEPVDWPTFWPANGGRYHGGDMVALKWDAVWCRISFIGVPVPPFQLPSGYDVEDVDRDEAEAFGLIKAGDRVPVVKMEVNLAEITKRLAARLQQLQ